MSTNLRRFFAWLMLWSTVAPAVNSAVPGDFHPSIGQEVVYKNPNDDQTPPRRARVTSVDAKGWCWIEFVEFFPNAHNRQEHCPVAFLKPVPPALAAKTPAKGFANSASAAAGRMLW